MKQKWHKLSITMAIIAILLASSIGFLYFRSLKIKDAPTIKTKLAVPDTATSFDLLRTKTESNNVIKTELIKLKKDETKIRNYPLESVIQLYNDILYRTDTIVTDTTQWKRPDSIQYNPR